MWPVSVLTTAKPRMRPGVSPAAFRPSGGSTPPVTASAALHQEIAIPLLGHGEDKVDAKLLAANSGAAIDDAFDSAICRYGSTVARPVEIRDCGSIRNRFGFRDLGFYDFTARSFKALQRGARLCLLGPRTGTQHEYGPYHGVPQSGIQCCPHFPVFAPTIENSAVGEFV